MASSSSSGGPSGRSPFPASRAVGRTRMSRPSLESHQHHLNNNPHHDDSHSPFLQGLLRFSPNNNANYSNNTNHWSPRPPSTVTTASRPAFFGSLQMASAKTAATDHAIHIPEETTTSSSHQHHQQQQQQQQQQQLPSNDETGSSKQLVVDGLPLDRIRSLATHSLLENPLQATFYASLLYAKTSNPDDALLLARAHLQAQNYTACLRTLEQSTLLQSTEPWEALLVACAALAAQQQWPALCELLEDACRRTSRTDAGPASRPLDDHDNFGWYVLAEETAYAAITSPSSTTTSNGDPNTYKIHVLARICCWRGLAYHETGHVKRAALYWRRALEIDAQCQAAWDHLLDRHLINVAESYQLLRSLNFSGLEWLRALYLAKIEVPPHEKAKLIDEDEGETMGSGQQQSFSFGLQATPALDASMIPFSSPISIFNTPAGLNLNPGKPTNHEDKTANKDATGTPSQMQTDVDAAFEKLWNDYKLQNSPHVLAMAARRAYRRYQWKTCLHYCESLAQIDPAVSGAAYCYLACLVLLGYKQVLFRVAHEWVEASPKSSQAWFAVGCYYYACDRYHVAQRHFCRATRLDPHCTAAWIAFGCSFAACDESDQALASYRAAQRLSPGEHSSLLYMGMEYVRTNHLVLAQHFLHAALAASNGSVPHVSGTGDPLCLHELGVLYAQKGEPQQAIQWFERALATIVKCSTTTATGTTAELIELIQDSYWEPTLFGLGHCYRQKRQFDKALTCFAQCVALCPDKASTYAALAFTKHLMHDLDGAIDLYHQALSLKSDEPFSTEMLQRALQEQATMGMSAMATTVSTTAAPRETLWAHTTQLSQSDMADDTFDFHPSRGGVGVGGDEEEEELEESSMDMDLSDSRATP